jgi:lipopolysaccharide transport system permease protein
VSQVLMFVSPVVYPASIVPERYEFAGHVWPLRTLFGINPMAGVIEGFRWSLLQAGPPPGDIFWVSVLATLLLLVSGLMYFRRIERRFADIV